MIRDRNKRAVTRDDPTGAKGQIIKLLEPMARSRQMHDVFTDFVAMAARAVSNRFDRGHFKQREAEYLQISKRYTREELTNFGHALGALHMGLGTAGIGVHTGDPGEINFRDLLGETYMALDLGNANVGQFFTPASVCRLMARLTIDRDAVERAVASKGFITLHEPAVGGGATVIHYAEVLRDAGFDHTGCMHAVAVDVSDAAVNMAYLQLSLLGIPAVVLHGNSLTMQFRATWYTPMHIISGWSKKLDARENGPGALETVELAPHQEGVTLSETMSNAA